MSNYSNYDEQEHRWEEEEEEEDEEEEKEPQHSFLLIGKSGRGKTTLVRRIVKTFGRKDRPVLALNDRTRDCPYQKVEWKNIKQLQNVSLLVEDVIGCRKPQFEALQELLNYSNHHLKVFLFGSRKIFCFGRTKQQKVSNLLG